jgi:hypothetical protein
VPVKWFTAGVMTCGQCGARWEAEALTCARCGARASQRVVRYRAPIPPLAMALILVVLGTLSITYTVGLWNVVLDLLLPPQTISGPVTALTPQGQDHYLMTIGHTSSGYLDLCAGRFIQVGDRVTATYSANNHTLEQLQVTQDASGAPVTGRMILAIAGTGLCPSAMPPRQVRLINIAVGSAIVPALDILTLILVVRWVALPLWRRAR